MRTLAWLFLGASLSAAYGPVPRAEHRPLPATRVSVPYAPVGWRETTASFYRAKPAHVRLYGTRYVCAHRTLRPGTRVVVERIGSLPSRGERLSRTRPRVTNQVYPRVRRIYTVCGTGPFVRGRDLDLALDTREDWGFRNAQAGLCRVRYAVVKNKEGRR